MQPSDREYAKTLGWEVEKLPHITKRLGAHRPYFVLIAPDGKPVKVNEDDKGYGDGWGDTTSAGAWDRLPDTLDT